jgi:hypothetical protein
MDENWLYVNWTGGPEYINLDDLVARIKENDGKPGFEFFSYNVGSDGQICDYRPLLLLGHLDQNGQIGAFTLKYEKRGMYRDGTTGDGVLGTAEYRLENNKWQCKWQIAPGEEESDSSPLCELLNADAERTVRLAMQTLRNPKFRPMILDADRNKCVVTEESQPEALDAAHIHEVKFNGNDTVGNGITLRKDLHALFDAGLFIITSEGRFEARKGISTEYAKLLEDKALRPDTLQRIGVSLAKRNKQETP